MSTARRRVKSPRSLSGTSAHPTMVTQVNIMNYYPLFRVRSWNTGMRCMSFYILMVMNGWLTSFSSLSIGRPIPEIKLFQTLILKLQGQGHGCGQRARSYNRPSIILTHFLFISYDSDQFRNLTLKHPRSRSWVRSKIKVTYCIQYPTNALPIRFTSIGPTIPEIWPISVWPWKNTSEIFKENLPK